MLVGWTSGNTRQSYCLGLRVGHNGNITDRVESRGVIHRVHTQRKALAPRTPVRISRGDGDNRVAKLIGSWTDCYRPIGSGPGEVDILIWNQICVSRLGGDDQSASRTLEVLDGEGNRGGGRV